MRNPLFRLIIPAFNPLADFPRQSTMLGPVLIASAINRLAGWEAELIDENNCSRRPLWLQDWDDEGSLNQETLQKIRPASVVGFYANWSSTVTRIFFSGEFYQNEGVLTIAGGYHIRHCYEEALANGIDIAVLSDDEETITKILAVYDQLSQKENFSWPEHTAEYLEEFFSDIPNIAFIGQNGQVIVSPQIEQQKKCPANSKPDFHLLRYGDLQVFPLQWRKGCPKKCEYCAAKEKYNPCTAEDFLTDVQYYVDNFQAGKFFIIDDQFFGFNKKDNSELERALSLLIEYQQATEQQLEFNVQMPLSASLNGNLLELMRQAGIKTVRIAYDSLIKQEWEAQWLYHQLENAIHQTDLWRKAGFKVHGLLTFAYPHPTTVVAGGDRMMILDQGDGNFLCPIIPLSEQEKQVKDFIRRAKLDELSISLAVPVPGTKLRERLIAEGNLLKLDWQYYDGRFPLYCFPDYRPEEAFEALRRIKRSFHRWQTGRNILRLNFVRPSLTTIADFFRWPIKTAKQLQLSVKENLKERSYYDLLLEFFENDLIEAEVEWQWGKLRPTDELNEPPTDQLKK